MRKVTKIFRIIFLMSVIALIIIIVKELFFETKTKNELEDYNKKEEVEGTINIPNEQINYLDYITSETENNPDIVKEYLANGMKENNFKNTLSRENNYIKVDASYYPVSYNFEKQYTYEELVKLYKALATSEIVKLEVIGYSVDGREIYSIEIGKGTDKILLEGNIDASEIAPTLFLTKLAVDLTNEWESGIEDIKSLLEEHKIIMIPSINPDGYNYSIFGKDAIKNTDTFVYKNYSNIDRSYYNANLNGIAINRNMPTQLSALYLNNIDLSNTVSKDKNTNASKHFAGYEVGSEPETQALIYWMYKHYKDAHAYISLHSSGRVIYFEKPYLSDAFNKYSNECTKIIKEKTGYNIIESDKNIYGDGTNGTSTDMIAEIAHGYKFSTITGRLSTIEYGIKANSMTNNLCAITIETLSENTKNLASIKEEYSRRKIREAIIAIAEYKLNKN